MDLRYLKELFHTYLVTLTGILYHPYDTFTILFNKQHPFRAALLFAMTSIIISSGMLLSAAMLKIIPADVDANSLIKRIALCSAQVIVIVPIIGGYLHIFCKPLGGRGTIYVSLMIIMYSYVLAPYGILLYIVFLFIESLLGKPNLFGLANNPILAKIELFSESILGLFALYLFSRSVQVGHQMRYRRAFCATLLFAFATIFIGFFVRYFVIRITH